MMNQTPSPYHQQNGIFRRYKIDVDMRNFGQAQRFVQPIQNQGNIGNNINTVPSQFITQLNQVITQNPNRGKIGRSLSGSPSRPVPRKPLPKMPPSFGFKTYIRDVRRNETWLVDVQLLDRFLKPKERKTAGIMKQFNKKWSHDKTTKPPGKILKIFAIYNPKLWNPFDKYRLIVKADMKNRGMHPFHHAGPGNTVRRFHGTKQNCEFGVTTWEPCDGSKCPTCGIVRNGWQKKFTKKGKGSFNRLGLGCYFSATSSKANDYTILNWQGDLFKNKQIKTMFLGLVVCGLVHREKQNREDLTGPPKGFHSVVGIPKDESSDGKAVLNYDELCVYNDHAMYPRYMIHYK